VGAFVSSVKDALPFLRADIDKPSTDSPSVG
jgi:hypothetical protein